MINVKSVALVAGGFAAGTLFGMHKMAQFVISSIDTSPADKHYIRLYCENEEEANDIYFSMEDILKLYGYVTVADAYDLKGAIRYDHTANNRGWTEMHNWRIRPILDGGYELILPGLKKLED